MNGFRVAVRGDAERLVELIRSAYRGESSRQGWTSEADLVQGERISADQVRAIIDGPRSLMLVLEDGPGLLACCQLEDYGSGLTYFGTFAVSPAAQGGGIGRALMAQAERQAVASFGAVALEMTVLAQQDKLLAWYERLGFRRTGETRPFPVDQTFAQPLRDDLYFAVLIKQLPREPAAG
jgi:ribosomal protein S18 acetylase RimI-like enzyme